MRQQCVRASQRGQYSLSSRVTELATQGLVAAGIPVAGGSAAATMDLVDMPAPVREIMRAAYGDATAEVFLISAGVAVVALLSVLFIKERPLRRTVDIQPDVQPDIQPDVQPDIQPDVQPDIQPDAETESPTPELASASR